MFGGYSGGSRESEYDEPSMSPYSNNYYQTSSPFNNKSYLESSPNGERDYLEEESLSEKKRA